jgi:hypothetical protein
MSNAGLVAQIAKFGAEAASPSPEKMRAVMKEDTARWSDTIRNAQIRVQP